MMEMTRRGFLKGMAGILAAGAAPAAIGSGILMPVRQFHPTIYTCDVYGMEQEVNSLYEQSWVQFTALIRSNGEKWWTRKYILATPGSKVLVRPTGDLDVMPGTGVVTTRGDFGKIIVGGDLYKEGLAARVSGARGGYVSPTPNGLEMSKSGIMFSVPSLPWQMPKLDKTTL